VGFCSSITFRVKVESRSKIHLRNQYYGLIKFTGTQWSTSDWLTSSYDFGKSDSNQAEVEYKQDGSAYFIALKDLPIHWFHFISNRVPFFEEKPVIAIRPPWGWSLTVFKDSYGLPFIAIQIQGTVSVIWCGLIRDHRADETWSRSFDLR